MARAPTDRAGEPDDSEAGARGAPAATTPDSNLINSDSASLTIVLHEISRNRAPKFLEFSSEFHLALAAPPAAPRQAPVR